MLASYRREFFCVLPGHTLQDRAVCFTSTKLPELVAVAGFGVCGPRPAIRDPLDRRLMTTDNTPPPLALRPRDAARLLGVSPRTLWGWTRVGIVPCVRVGTGKRRTVLYPVADLQTWLTRQTEGSKGGGQ